MLSKFMKRELKIGNANLDRTYESSSAVICYRAPDLDGRERGSGSTSVVAMKKQTLMLCRIDMFQMCP